VFVVLSVIGVCEPTAAQDADESNQILAPAARANYAVGKWRYSGEFQVRLNENYRALNVWYLEGVATNLWFKHVELVPDLRFSVKPNVTEVRPGFGVILKSTSEKWQFASQSKYQADIPSAGPTGHGVRQVVFANTLLNEKFVPGLVGGGFYRWRGEFADFEFWRAGGGLTYIFDPLHTLSVSYFFGWENAGDKWTRSGFLLVQLSLNIRNDWKYVPAKIVNF